MTIGSSRFELPVQFSSDSRVAKWEQLRRRGQLVKVSVAKGKHTLKLVRRGPLPNLMALSVQPGWDAPPRKVRFIDRVAPIYRAAFLPPGAVNVAALKQAIGETTKTFGSRYPVGARHLKRLGDLDARQRAASDGAPEDQQKIADELSTLRREVLLSHPKMAFDTLLFVKRSTDGYGHTYSDQHRGERPKDHPDFRLPPLAGK